MTPTPATTPPAEPAAPPIPTVHAYDPALDPSPHRALTEADVVRWPGKHIAWSWDGTTILAGADTLDELLDQLERDGISWRRVAFGYIDDPNVSNL